MLDHAGGFTFFSLLNLTVWEEDAFKLPWFEHTHRSFFCSNLSGSQQSVDVPHTLENPGGIMRASAKVFQVLSLLKIRAFSVVDLSDSARLSSTFTAIWHPRPSHMEIIQSVLPQTTEIPPIEEGISAVSTTLQLIAYIFTSSVLSLFMVKVYCCAHLHILPEGQGLLSLASFPYL